MACGRERGATLAEDVGGARGAKGATLFISYAHADRAVVDRLIADLRAFDIACWIDRQDLKPGTPSWEQALRAAIRAADGVVLVCSPSALASRYVPDELRIAEMYQRTVYPFWVDGEHWMDSVPMGWGGAQNLDARGDRFSPALAALVAEVKAQMTTAVSGQPFGPATPAAPPRNPYKGLRAFRGTDAGDFFGRDRVVQELVEAVGATLQGGPHYLAVVGPSGSGKSSVVLAGLLPRLQGGALAGSAAWHYLAPLTPGAHPLEALAVTLAGRLTGSSMSSIRADLDASTRGLHLLARRLAQHGDERVVLVIDQLEELFTLTGDDEERQQFIDLLVTAVREPQGPLLAVLTLRADFYDRPMSYPELVALMDTRSKLLPPMDLEDLRSAITRPAALPDVQLRFEGDLVGDLLFEVRGQPGALPLAQFTLEQLFARRDGRLLTQAAYRELGGVRGALSRQAEATYTDLPSDTHRYLTRALFLRLIAPGATEQEATRRRAPLQELTLAEPLQSALMQQVVTRFVDARLLSTDQLAGQRTVEVSHEALIREWPRLAEWLREAREDIRLQQALSEDAAAWLRHDRAPDYLYRGTLLAEARDWLERNVPSADEQAFVTASVAEAAREAASEREQQERELAITRQAALASRQAARRLRYLVGVLGAFLIVAVLLSVIALQQQSQATANEHTAVRNEHAASAAQATAVAERNAAISSQLAQEATGLFATQYDLALLLGTEAMRFHDSQAARGVVLSGLLQYAGLLATLSGHTGMVANAAFSPDGKLLASASADGTIRLWDVAGSGPLGSPLLGHNGAVNSVAWSPDGKLLASGGVDGTVRLWSVATRALLGAPLTGHAGSVNSVAWSPNGKLLASGGADGTVRLWSVATRRQIALLHSGNKATVHSVAFSPDSTLVAAGSSDGTARLWRVADGSQTAVLLARKNGFLYGDVYSVAFSPNGTLLAAGSGDGPVWLWNVASHRQAGQPLIGPSGPVSGVSFNPGGTTLAASSEDGSIWLWNVSDGHPLTTINGQFGVVNSVAWSPDGTLLATGGVFTVRLWELKSGEHIGAPLPGTDGAMNSVAWSPNGTLLAAGGEDGTVWLWDVATRHLTGQILPGHGRPTAIYGIAFSPNGQLLAVDGGGVIQLWDVASRREAGSLAQGAAGLVVSMAFSPNGALLAAGTGQGTIQIWNVGTRLPAGPALTGHTGAVNSVAFSPDGTMLASGSVDTTVRLWNVTSRRQLGRPLVGAVGEVNSVAFSPSGALLAAGSEEGSIRLWNVAGHSLAGQPLPGSGGVTGMSFSPDGTILASADRGANLHFWDVVGSGVMGEPVSTTAIVSALAFSPNGSWLATGNAGDGSVWLWPVTTGDLPARACAVAGRNLTQQEWQQYLGAVPYEKTCPSAS